MDSIEKVDVSGPGYLAGESPDGLTTVSGVPFPATVKVYYELPSGDWQLVDSTTSGIDGTWTIAGLNPSFTFNVVGSLTGHRDVIVSGVQPIPTDQVTYSGGFIPNDALDGLDGEIVIVGGFPPYSVSVVDPLPVGLVPNINGRTLTIEGASADAGSWDSTIRVTASNGPHVDVPVEVKIYALDPYWDNVVSLLHFDGPNNSTTFVDETGLTWNVNGNTKLSTANSLFGGSSAYFDGSGDYMILPSWNPDFGFGEEDFTIEVAVRPASIGSRAILSTREPAGFSAHGWMLTLRDTGEVAFHCYRAASTMLVQLTGGSLSTSSMSHIAVTREGNTWRLFVDGIVVDSATVSGSIHQLTTYPPRIGFHNTDFPTRAFHGWIDELRVTKGVARYTSDFVLPTAPYPGDISPANFAATYNPDDREIELTWTDQCPFEDGFHVYRSTEPIPESELPPPYASVGEDVEVFVDDDVVHGTTYYYRVGAFVGSKVIVSDQVQRVAKWTPLDLATPPKILLDWESDVVEVSGGVSQWKDRSGNGADFYQNTSSRRPSVVEGALNGKRAIRFDGSDDYLICDSTAALDMMRSTPAGWCFSVCKKRSLDASAIHRTLIRINTGGGNQAVRFAAQVGTSAGENQLELGVRRLDGDGFSSLVTTGLYAADWALLQFDMDWSNGDGSIRRDCVEVASSTSLTSNGNTSNTRTQDPISLGASARDNSRFADIDVAALVVGSGSILTSTERSLLEGWAAWEFGLQDNLPNDHPYKLSPP